MFDLALQLTKRELQETARSPRFWLVLLASGFLLGLAGPFGTYDAMPFAPRIAYWIATALATYVVGTASVAVLGALTNPPRPSLAANALFGLIAGVPVAATVWLINRFAAGFDNPISYLALLPYCCVIAAVGSPIIALLSNPAASAPIPDMERPSRPRILDRLPLDRRGVLSHITVQDHYVDVRTDKGGALVLLRLADAIAETQGIDGLQIHRSHWVARTAVARSVRRGGRLHLELRDGTLLPVSRSNLAAVRAAGLI